MDDALQGCSCSIFVHNEQYTWLVSVHLPIYYSLTGSSLFILTRSRGSEIFESSITLPSIRECNAGDISVN